MSFLDPHTLLANYGAIGVFLILLAETGLLIGFFLPGDSLLFAAGVLCATSATSALHLSLPAVLAAAALGALLGAELGFLIGHRAGPPLLARFGNGKLQAAAMRAEAHLERYGVGKAVVLARFVPVVRTVMNPLAGVLGVPARVFTMWQVAGGLLWSLGVTLAGFALGSSVSNVDRYLLPIVGVVVVVSLIPVALEVLRARREPAAAATPGVEPVQPRRHRA